MERRTFVKNAAGLAAAASALDTEEPAAYDRNSARLSRNGPS